MAEEEAKWYVVHTYSGYENTVKATIEKNVESRHLENLIEEVLIPMETVTEVTEKGTKTVDRKIYPGYVLIKMRMTDQAWYIVNSVRGVTSFVGADTDAKPMIRAIPLTAEEVAQLGIEKHTVEAKFSEGDTVSIVDGPLTGMQGQVSKVDVDAGTLEVTVSMFGRATPVELDFEQVRQV